MDVKNVLPKVSVCEQQPISSLSLCCIYHFHEMHSHTFCCVAYTAEPVVTERHCVRALQSGYTAERVHCARWLMLYWSWNCVATPATSVDRCMWHCTTLSLYSIVDSRFTKSDLSYKGYLAKCWQCSWKVQCFNTFIRTVSEFYYGFGRNPAIFPNLAEITFNFNSGS